MNYKTTLKIRFAHCDQAGIVFYPRYFEFFNSVVEDWCEDSLDCSFRTMHSQYGYGLPLVHVDCTFSKPAELGETLQAQLSVSKLGNTSVHVDINLSGADDGLRVSANMVLVLMDLNTRKAIALPESLRQKMMQYLK